MGSKKAHSKSRLGCAQCKKRRVKCDGRSPSCVNCAKRALQCSFLQLIPTPRLTPLPYASPPELALVSTQHRRPYDVLVFRNAQTHNATMQLPASTSNGFDRTISRLVGTPYQSLSAQMRNSTALSKVPSELLYLIGHYRNSTSLTLANDDPAKRAWQAFVPELAANHAHLMRSILSVAALQLGYLHSDPKQSASLNAIAVDQTNQALITYRPAIEDITESNAPSLFATATLTTVFAFRTATVDLQEILTTIPAGVDTVPHATAEQLTNSVARTVWSVRSALSVLSPGWQWVKRSELNALSTRDWWPEPECRVPVNAKAMKEDSRLCAIQMMLASSSTLSVDDAQCLTSALQELRQTYALVSQLTVPIAFVASASNPSNTSTVNVLKDRAAIIAWAAKIPRQYVKLLECGNCEAMVIVAHWAILLARVCNVWWSGHLGASIIEAVAMVLGGDKWDLLRWPIEAAGVVVKMELRPGPTASHEM